MFIQPKTHSTKQSLDYVDHSHSSYKSNFMTSMFLEDFCNGLYFRLKDKKEEKFYYTESKRLAEIIGFCHEIDDYDFDNIVSTCIYDLLLYGKAYIEQILHFDEKEKLVKIQFKTICYNKKFKLFNKLHYVLKKNDGNWKYGNITLNNVIELNLKDMGYSRLHFRRILNKLNKFKLLSNNIALDKNIEFDFSLYHKYQDIKLLKTVKDVYWSGRGGNQYITEPFLLYRSMKLNLLQKKFIDFILVSINGSLDKLGEIYGFSGKISCCSKTDEYDKLFEELQTGGKNCDQISKVVYGF